VQLSNNHRIGATELSVKGLRGEMNTRSSHRLEVMGRNERLLEGEKEDNIARKAASEIRRRKIERARRKLDRIRSDNKVV
jgi:hypothetical protein